MLTVCTFVAGAPVAVMVGLAPPAVGTSVAVTVPAANTRPCGSCTWPETTVTVWARNASGRKQRANRKSRSFVRMVFPLLDIVSGKRDGFGFVR